MRNRKPAIRALAVCLSVVPIAALSVGCAQQDMSGRSGLQPENAGSLADLTAWLTGSFSSEEQASEAPGRVAPVHMHQVRIWPDRDDAVWFYVEQALATEPASPYRQRVYRLIEAERGVFELDTFTIPDRVAHAGAWRRDDPLSALNPDALTLREGCTVVITTDGPDSFRGSTIGRGCPSQLSDASYATSHIRVSPNRIESWDRGFNARGEQVWGAVDSGYIFARMD